MTGARRHLRRHWSSCDGGAVSRAGVCLELKRGCRFAKISTYKSGFHWCAEDLQMPLYNYGRSRELPPIGNPIECVFLGLKSLVFGALHDAMTRYDTTPRSVRGRSISPIATAEPFPATGRNTQQPLPALPIRLATVERSLSFSSTIELNDRQLLQRTAFWISLASVSSMFCKTAVLVSGSYLGSTAGRFLSSSVRDIGERMIWSSQTCSITRAVLEVS